MNRSLCGSMKTGTSTRASTGSASSEYRKQAILLLFFFCCLIDLSGSDIMLVVRLIVCFFKELHFVRKVSN